MLSVSWTINYENYQCPQLKAQNQKLKQIILKWIIKNIDQFLSEKWNTKYNKVDLFLHVSHRGLILIIHEDTSFLSLTSSWFWIQILNFFPHLFISFGGSRFIYFFNTNFLPPTLLIKFPFLWVDLVIIISAMVTVS